MLHVPKDRSDWRIGDSAPPPARHRGAVGMPMAPAWFALEVPPQGEPRACRWLEARQVEAWFPSETVWRKVRGSRVGVQMQRPVVPRFVFARFTGEPQWDILFASRRITGFIGVGGLPRPITDAEIGRMATVPDRIAEACRRKAEAKIVRPGDSVTITDGAMAGWEVRVSAVTGEVARFIVPILGDHETEIAVHRLTKTQPLDRCA